MFREQDEGLMRSFKMKSLDGDEVELAKYEGPVVMIVNVASKCGSPPSFSRERWLRPAVEP